MDKIYACDELKTSVVTNTVSQTQRAKITSLQTFLL